MQSKQLFVCALSELMPIPVWFVVRIHSHFFGVLLWVKFVVFSHPFRMAALTSALTAILVAFALSK